MQKWSVLGVRIVASVIFLIVIWHNSHWSVAFALTLLFVSAELNTLLRKLDRRKCDELCGKETDSDTV